MAWGYYLNMEVLSSSIIDDQISRLTNTNYQEVDYNVKADNGDEFIANLKHGFISVVMIICYVESSINSLLRDYSGYRPDGKLIESSIETKLEVLFAKRDEKLRQIRADCCWRDFNRIRKVRNQLIHYKNNTSGVYSSWPPIDQWEIGGGILGDFFTRDVILRYWERACQLIQKIVEALDLKLNPDRQIIGCDARFGVPSSFCTLDRYAEIVSELEQEAFS